ncbi:hypothetical protein COW36_18855 [bacterium (Candidatus Blackallbacteria) CG17_big_fil_post_rev_8_21_14_2_50_48_46]|uniref:TolC family protein n=1 Tax=bacterium (Candidatus Blackallbacteria) CG17_big_fil_post_rev_8_21_14_2_50_48_46 TaxID=2014261 RepID=A0A2M7G040_9BACT|nr:MAG: hypothetical protein COW64_25615 [bacterium (Candidatus Blackallbacteria) CG18_big_fil_WC_8_21_14_2_50_49_26]PIW14987.1 MAG: hypothetical protein COW36_18855 [bacterium (Candidatus Blackallbacteria) CG17_big_fil_post_rev_8_21_14_2_50_48_46]PIW50068.1 MAG: hypothetical protein COW20_03790 [bacterium (Candidatus Blackallbacteria) CG13_big_fil_rev_8_21_14_2_50_49_14]
MPKIRLALMLLGLTLQGASAGLAEEIPSKTTHQAPAHQLLTLNILEAGLLALKNNPALKLELLQVENSTWGESLATARFDPRISASANLSGDNTPRILGNSTEFIDILSRSSEVRMGLEKEFETGSKLALDVRSNFSGRTWSDRSATQNQTRIGLSFTQALLQGQNPEVNRASIELAREDKRLAEFRLQGLALSIVAETEQAFWDYLQSLQSLALVQESLALIEQELSETETRIALGRLAPVEKITLEAEVALRQQDLNNAEAEIQRNRLNLLRLIQPDPQNWAVTPLQISLPLELPEEKLEAFESHLALALKQRPEILQAQTEINQQRLEIVRTRDGLLPKLDLFISLGKSGYAEAFLGSLGNLPGSGFDLTGGAQFSYSLGSRAEKAKLEQALNDQKSQSEALHNLQVLVEFDLRKAWLELNLARTQIQTAKKTKAAQSARLEAEKERYHAGRGLAFALAQAQRDHFAAKIEELKALIIYHKRLSAFFRYEGSLLHRRGIVALPRVES